MILDLLFTLKQLTIILFISIRLDLSKIILRSTFFIDLCFHMPYHSLDCKFLHRKDSS